MSSKQRLGIVAVVVMFIAALAVPADAQRRHGSGQGGGGGASAAPRQAQGGPPPSAGPRGQGGPPPSAGPRGQGGPPPSTGPRPPQGQGGHQAVPRPGGPGHGHPPGPGYGGRPYYGHYPGYGYRGYYPSFYWGFGGYYGPYFYSPWLYSPYWYYPPYPYYYDYGPGGSSLKVEVQPKNAEVYIDGHLAGIVDQFDGMFQSLSVEPGGHEITIYLEGFRSIRQQLYLSPGSTYRIKATMEKLAAGEPNEPRPQAAPEPQAQMAPSYRSVQPQSPPSYSPEPQGPPPEANPPIPSDSRFGQVAIRVQPGDADVLIDGEPWRSPAGADRLVVHLAAGTHRVEIRKEGYDPFVTAVEIRRGETAVINVSLARF